MVKINNGNRNKGRKKSNLFLVGSEWLSLSDISKITSQKYEKVRQAIGVGVMSAEEFINRYKTEKI